MANIQDEIFEQFCQQLAKTGRFSAAKIKQIRELFAGGRKPKPNDLVKLFSEKEPEESLP